MTIPGPPDPARLHRSARTCLTWAFVCWGLFGLLLLGSLVSAVRPTLSYAEPNAAYLAGRAITPLILLGVPLVLAIVFTVRQSKLRKQAEAIERAMYYPPAPGNSAYPANGAYPYAPNPYAQNPLYPDPADPRNPPFLANPQNPANPAGPQNPPYPAAPQNPPYPPT